MLDASINTLDQNTRLDTIIAPDHLVEAYKHLGIHVIPMSEYMAHGEATAE